MKTILCVLAIFGLCVFSAFAEGLVPAAGGGGGGVGWLILVGPNESGEGPVSPEKGKVTIRVLCRGMYEVGGIQTKLRFTDPNGDVRGDFKISLKNGNPNFGGQAIFLGPGCPTSNVFPLYEGSREMAGVVFIDGSYDLGIGPNFASEVYDLIYELPLDSPAGLPFGTYLVDVDWNWTVVAGKEWSLPFNVIAGSFTLAGWKILGDATGDCRVDIMDIIYVRNRLGQSVSSGDNWRADVNQDGKINILDMIFVRNNLMTKCKPATLSVITSGDEYSPTIPVVPGAKDLLWAVAELDAYPSNQDIQIWGITVLDKLGDSTDDFSSITNAEIWADLGPENSPRGDVFETKISNTEQFDTVSVETEMVPKAGYGPVIRTHTFFFPQYLRIQKGSLTEIALIADLDASANIGDSHTFTFISVSGSGAMDGETILESDSGKGWTLVVQDIPPVIPPVLPPE